MARGLAAARQKERDAETELMREYIERASVSRQVRQVQADDLRQWYETGTGSGYAARYNKLRSHLDRLASYLWSPDAVRFGVHLPPAARAEWLQPAATARDEFRSTWRDSGADLAISLGLEWALVYGAEVLKVQQDPQRGFVVSAIEPWDFGVTREDQPSLTDQDVLCHWYRLSMPQFERWCLNHPEEDRFIELASREARQPAGSPAPTRLIVTGVAGVFPNAVLSGAMADQVDETGWLLEAQVKEPCVVLVDVWVRRTYRLPGVTAPFEDWQVTTLLSESKEWLVRRRNPVLPWTRTAAGTIFPGDHPFTMLVPRPVQTYLWGRSELLALLALQQWRERQIVNMDEIVRRQLDPSKFFSGISDYEEANRAMSTVGGAYGASDPGAKMTPIQYQIGQEAFAMIQQIDEMFEDQSGIPPTLAGEMPPGVRAQNQLVAIAGIGAGRIRHMALQLESALSRVATLGFRLLQLGDDQTYESPDGTRFLLAQLPPGITLQVSAHSASPVFAEQTQAKVMQLSQLGAIDGEWAVELLDPPYREEIKEVARKLAAGRAEQQKELMQLALERIKRRSERIGPDRPTGR